MIFACALRDRLVRQARDGDAAALDALVSALPADMPRWLVVKFRDSQLRRLARAIMLTVPDATTNRCAVILAQAGKDIAAGRSISDRPPYSDLTADEREHLAIAIADMVEWTQRWPGVRAMNIIVR